MPAVSISESYKRPKKLFKAKHPATILKELLQLRELTRDCRIWLRTMVPRPTPAEVIPSAIDLHLSKHFLTISKLDRKTQLVPAPRRA